MNILDHFLPALVAAFRAVLTASWQGSIAIVLVCLARQAMGLRAPARWHYLLWSVVIIRLLVPALVLPHNPTSLENIPVVAHPFPSEAAVVSPANVHHEIAGVMPGNQTTEPVPAPRAEPTPQAAAQPMRKPWPWWSSGALVWLAGAVVVGSCLIAGAVRVRRRLLRETFPVEEAIEAVWRESCRRWLGRPAPRIRAAEWMASPALLGLWRPTLLIPRESPSAFSRADWEHVFAHEIAHLRFRDHWSQLLLLLALCVHWFNPLVWVGLRRLRVDRELAADEWALQRLEGGRALAYGETLFKTLAARPGHFFQPGLVGISEDGAQMKQRLRRITVFRRRGFYGSVAGAAALLALGAILLGQGTPPTAPAPESAGAKPEEKSAAFSLQPPAVAAPTDVAGELLAAARAGDAAKMKDLLNLPDRDARSSSQHQAVQVLDDLLKKRELAGYTLLLDALLQRPIGKRWYLGDPDLAALVKEGRTDFLEALLARKLALNRLSALAKTANPATAEWIQRRVAEVGQQRADIKALGQAAADGDLPALGHLVEAGADVNGVGEDDNTPLLRAVFKDRVEAAQFLLEHGALVDKPRHPGWDYTPLCEARSVAMAEVLKKAGANIHAKLFGRDVSILTQVAMWRSADLVAWFLQQGLDPKMVGDNNQTLLFYLKDGRTAELLLAAGVDPNRADEFGQTALGTARSAEVAQALVDHGAKVKGLPSPLLRHMVMNGSAGAMEVVLKAGCDQDPDLLQQTLGDIDVNYRNNKDFPETEKMRELLIARGAKPYPLAPELRKAVTYKGKIATADDAFIDYTSVKVNYHEAFVSPAVSSTVEGSDYVDDDGSLSMRPRSDSTSITYAATADGYATTYAGPFTPPYKEKLDGLRLTLGKGFSAHIQTVDETGKPIAGAKLQGYYPGPPRTTMAEVSTDTSGTAMLEHVGTAPLNVRVGAEGYQSDELVDLHLDPASPYRVTLKPGKSVFGTVISQVTGQPVAGAAIKLAGVRGPHAETYSDPGTAPLLGATDAQGRFRLTTLRADSTYYFYVQAPRFGGLFIEGISAQSDELRITLPAELTVRGKITRVPASYMSRGKIFISYEQPFVIGKESNATGSTVEAKVVNGEAEFSIGGLYANPVDIRLGRKEVHLETKDLPKSDLVIDLGS